MKTSHSKRKRRPSSKRRDEERREFKSMIASFEHPDHSLCLSQKHLPPDKIALKKPDLDRPDLRTQMQAQIETISALKLVIQTQAKELSQKDAEIKTLKERL